MSAADVTDGNSEEVARGDEEEAAWLDLVGRFDAPASIPGSPLPWPERENLEEKPPPGDGPADNGPAGDSPAPRSAPGPGSIVIWRSDSAGNGLGLSGGHATSGVPAGPGPGTPAPGAPGRAGGQGPVAPGRSGPSALDDDDEEHYVPPPPPPLPNLSPIAKGAWLALFGGPAYLVIATLAGWSVSGLAMFLSVGAFIAGFTILVLHLGDRGSDDDDSDDGAVV